MSANLLQVYTNNPASSLQATDLFYLIRSPYGAANDMGVPFSVFQSAFLQPANNLSDVSNVAISRTNLGLGSAAVKNATLGASGLVSSVTGSITNGHVPVYFDVFGTITDSGFLASDVVLKTGTTFTGFVILNADPVAALGAATKQYTDAQAAAGMPWIEVTGTSQAMSNNTAYIANNASQVIFSLPAVSPQGSILKVAGLGSGGWAIACGAGQKITFGDISTTTGVGGALVSTLRSDYVEILCVIANTTFKVLSSQGNLQTS